MKVDEANLPLYFLFLIVLNALSLVECEKETNVIIPFVAGLVWARNWAFTSQDLGLDLTVPQ